MNVGIFTDTKDSSGTDLLVAALKKHPVVKEITLLNAQALSITINTTYTIAFGQVELTKDNFDILIFRGGHKEIALALLIAKYCESKGIKVFDNNLHKVHYLINKKVDAVNFALAGLPVPRTYFFSELSQMNKLLPESPLIVKPVNTGKGMDVRLAYTYNDVEKILQETEREVRSMVLQEFIEYQKDLRLLVIGQEVVASMERIPQKGDFRANFSLGGEVIPFESTPEMKQLALAAAQACNLEYAGIDLLVDKDDKVFVLEANRTPGFEGISLVMGFNVAEKLVEYILCNKMY